MRTEKALVNYFDSCLTFIKQNPSAKFYEPAIPVSNTTTAGNSPVIGHAGDRESSEVQAPSRPGSSVVHVVIVRKLDELHELVDKRKEVLHELEAAHVNLARQVMSVVAAHVRIKAKQLTLKERLLRVKEKEVSQDMDILVEALGPFLQADSKEGKIWKSWNPEKRTILPNRTIWEAMADLPPHLLDPYQPTTKLKVFRGQHAPSIDYFLTKLNLLTVSYGSRVAFGGLADMLSYFLSPS
jgi:hypothetical protein